MTTLTWLILLTTAAVITVGVTALLRHVHRTEEEPRTTPRWPLVLAVVVPALALGATAFVAVRHLAAPDGPWSDTVRVEIVGHRFWWEVRYPGTPAVTANEVHLPVDTDVELHVTSYDVWHHFVVPDLPGTARHGSSGTARLRFRLSDTGVHQAVCAIECGVGHEAMDGVVVVHDRRDFEDWLDRNAEPATAAGRRSGDGEQLFGDLGCASCHTIRGTVYDGEIGPDLTHVASRRRLAGVAANDRASLEALITDPGAVKRGSTMPPVRARPEELEALVTFLSGLR